MHHSLDALWSNEEGQDILQNSKKLCAQSERLISESNRLRDSAETLFSQSAQAISKARNGTRVSFASNEDDPRILRRE